MRQQRILREAEISSAAVRYQVLSATVGLVLTIVGIPLIPLIVPFIWWYYSRYYARLRVVLTARELKVHRGLLVTEEKSIPLEKITDLAVFQGPVMRAMDLKGIQVETAGQTSPTGALVKIVGITETDEFRDMVLEQRDRIADRDDEPAMKQEATPSVGSTASSQKEVVDTLREIRDLLRRIETKL